MVRMQVRCDDVRRRFTAHAVGERSAPKGPACLRVDTGIDDDPAVLVTQQPQVNVFERERQWHA